MREDSCLRHCFGAPKSTQVSTSPEDFQDSDYPCPHGHDQFQQKDTDQTSKQKAHGPKSGGDQARASRVLSQWSHRTPHSPSNGF